MNSNLKTKTNYLTPKKIRRGHLHYSNKTLLDALRPDSNVSLNDLLPKQEVNRW